MTPTVHYNMGGIPTNYHGEVVTLKDGNPDSVVPGLFAVGEAACVSVHGANRLGSNSLIDLVVFGRAAGLRLAEVITPGAPQPALTKEVGQDRARPARPLPPRRGRHRRPPRSASEMQRTMQADCAVFRTERTLDEGVAKIDAIYKKMADVAGHRPQPDLEQRSDRDARARQYARPGGGDDALRRQPQGKPRRAHARGFPRARRRQLDEAQPSPWFDGWGGKGGGVAIDYRPVHEYTLTDEIAYIKPKARVY